jgi:hypothetical protein
MEDNIQKKDFSIEEALKFGWNTMKANFWFFFGIIWTAFAISFVPNVPMQLIIRRSQATIGGFIAIIVFYIVAVILSAIVQMGYINIALHYCADRKPKYRDFFKPYPLLIKYIISSILYGLITMAGFILLIVPSVIWGIKFQFFGYFIVEQKCGPIEALKKSAAITKHVKWKLLLFGIVLYLINILGFIALIIGIFAAVPTTLVAYTYVYRRLLSQTVDSSGGVPEKMRSAEAD